MPPKSSAAPIAVKPNALKGKSLIVTGEIEGYNRKAAEAILINAGATIEKSLNKKVQLVVLGADPGANKLEKIAALGVETKDWDDVVKTIKVDGNAAPAPADEEDEDEDEDDEDDDDDEEEEDDEVEEKPKPKAKAKAAPRAKANTKAKAAPAPKPAAKTSVKASAKASAKASTSSGDDDDVDGKTVIVTGAIAGHDRKSANAILEKAGASIAKSLNKQVQLVILGSDPGSDKLAKIEDMGVPTVQWKDVADKLGVQVKADKVVPEVKPSEAPDSVDGLTLLITGNIDGMTRPAAQRLLEDAGATFAKSLNKSVELVVLGAKPGPDKLAKIADLGIDTVTFEDLAEKLGLDVDGPSKKKAKKA